MARYKVLVKAVVATEYEAIAARADRRRILGTIASLERNPRPLRARRLPERERQRRLRLGRYRLLYEIDEQHKIVTVFRIVDRRPENPT